jgi:tetratricopeptide (TPR) repeat protein
LQRALDRSFSILRRRAVWAAAGLLLVAAAAGERGTRGPEDPVRRAAELLEARQPVAALAELDRLAETPRAHDARVEVVRGRAEHALGQYGMAFSDFASAAEKDARALDERAIEALADELDAESFPPVWRPALVRLLGEKVGRESSAAVRRLLASPLARTRDDALEVLELAGSATDDDRLRVASADLADPRAPCASHREAVQRLAVAGGQRAEKLLEQASWRSGCGGAQARDALRRMRRKE